MTDNSFKRNIAYKYRIGDLLIGKQVNEGERFSFLELGNKKIVRVNIIGNIIDKFENESQGGTKYLFMTIDDGSGQTKLKIFGKEEVDKYAELGQGDTILVIGTLRSFNNDLYISPEIIRKKDPKYLLIRKLELEKQRAKDPIEVGKEKMIAVKDKILGTIKNAEEQGGIETEQIIMQLKDISPDIVNQEVQKLIEEGIVFEPHPGKVRYLG